MEVKIPSGNWLMALADALENEEVDTIILDSDLKVEMALIACDDMGINRDICFIVEEDDPWERLYG